jgi:transposase
MEEVDEQELHVERIAALDLGKAVLEACVRVPHESKPARRMQEVRTYPTTTAALLQMADWFRCWGVTRVVMESTGDYWKGVYYLLEAEGFECWLVNARDVKNVPGRAKTDLLTELRGGSRRSVRQLPVGGATLPGHDRRRGRRAGSVPVGGCATRVA